MPHNQGNVKMNEFKFVPKDKLENALTAIISYMHGCEDTFVLIKEQHERTMKLYKEKIMLCKEEIKIREND